MAGRGRLDGRGDSSAWHYCYCEVKRVAAAMAVGCHSRESVWLCDAVAGSECGRFGSISAIGFVEDAGHVVGDRVQADDERFSNLTVALPGCDELDYFDLTGAQASGVAVGGNWRSANSRLQGLSPGEQGIHAELFGKGGSLCIEFGGAGHVAIGIAAQQGFGIVAACPGQLGSVSCLAAEREALFEVGYRLVELAHGIRRQPKQTVRRH